MNTCTRSKIMNFLYNFNSDVYEHILEYLDLGGLIEMKRASGFPIPSRRFIRRHVREYLKQKNGIALKSLLREEIGFEQYAKLSYLDFCLAENSYDCYVILRQHFKKYKHKKSLPDVCFNHDESKNTEAYKKLIRFLYDEGEYDSSIDLLIYDALPYDCTTITREQLEEVMESDRHILGEAIVEKIYKYMKNEFGRRAQRFSSGLLQLIAYGTQDVYFTG